MKSYIKSIILLNNTEKRIVPLEQGVNIITGDSKTGKSALLEIIDYCLCSSRSTIPKGKITEFTTIYCIALVIESVCYVIGRKSSDLGGKMCLVKESLDFETELLAISYFDDKNFQSPDEVKYQIESALGLLVTNMQVDNIDEKPQKASLRNMVSYLFQHQNLMASKFALFYRFNDFYKRKSIIQQFPVFAGLVGQEYYSKLIRLNELKAKLKKMKKDEDTNKIAQEKARKLLVPLLENYFSLLNLNFDNTMSLPKMIKLSKELPVFDDSQSFNTQGIWERYNNLKQKLENLREDERELNIQISDIERANNVGHDFVEALEELKEKTNIAIPDHDNTYTCPLCGNSCPTINEMDQNIINSSTWLDEELEITSKYTADFSEDIRKLTGKKDDIVSEINKIWKEIKDIEKNYINSEELQSQKNKIEYAKAQIILYVDMFNDGVFKNINQDIEDLKDKIKILEVQLDGFDLETAMQKAQTFISENMNNLAEKLDFEKEYEPINLNFGLVDSTFDIYHHQNKKEKIYLYEMGSGANWVSTHIALFLSFMRFFCKNPKAPILPIMFFDQPSQVYFPHPNEEKKSSDIVAVQNMYQTIFDEINSIGNDYGFLPQIIIVDHVTGLELKNKEEFTSYIRREWRGDQHLI